jgi:hypothetical protein
MKEPSGSEKQGKTKSKRGGRKQGVTDSGCKESKAASSRIDEVAGNDDVTVDVSGTEGETLTAHSEEEEDSTRKKSRSEES